jgi:hypothetical protein
VRFQKWHVVLLMVAAGRSQAPSPDFPKAIRRAWEDEDMASLKAPLANPLGSPKHVSVPLLHRVPLRTIYRPSPVYYKGGAKTNA